MEHETGDGDKRSEMSEERGRGRGIESRKDGDSDRCHRLPTGERDCVNEGMYEGRLICMEERD